MSEFNYECVSDVSEIEVADDILELFLKHQRLDWYKQFGFAAHELLINSVEAMSKQAQDNDKLLYVKITMDSSAVTFSVTDTGGGLPDEVIDKFATCDILSMEGHGRGLLMINSLVDDFIFLDEGDGKHTYKIIKNRITSINSEEI